MLKITAVRFAPYKGGATAHVYITDGDHEWRFTRVSNYIRAEKASDISPDAVRLDTDKDYHVEVRRASVSVGEYRKARALACKAMAHAYTAFDEGRSPAVSLRRKWRRDADVLDAVLKSAGETASKALLLLGAYDAEQAYHAEQASLRRDSAARSLLDPDTPEWEAHDLWRYADKSDDAAQEARDCLNSAAHTMSLIGLLPGFISFHGCIDVTEALWGDYAPTKP